MMQQHDSCDTYQCDVCKIPYFERNNYFHGKMLSARDLKAEQTYFNEKRWLINRMTLGWGIVCGLEVSPENSCLFVGPGLALDCCGHELLVCRREGLHLSKIAEALGQDPCEPFKQIRWGLCLEYRECKAERVNVASSCQEDECGREYNRIRDHYSLTIRPFDEACPEDHDGYCCPYEGLGHQTSIHKALTEKSRECAKCKKCECVLLATGTLERCLGQELEIHLDEDSWKYRRIVYTNPALASLIRCFHGELAHISEINWRWGANAHYEVDDFLALLTGEHLQVTFDRQMNQTAVKDPKSMRLSIFLPTNSGSCPVQFLIPVDHIEYQGNVAKYYFDHACIEHDLRKACKKLSKPAEVEIVLHGSMVRDHHDRALDAELIRDFPTGNGVQGGEFITYFTVGP